jgi:hypothetical protein
MNSFKKIAFVIAAALTGTMLVAPASNAAAMTVATTTWNAAKVGGAGFDTPATDGVTAANAIARPVPADNSVDNVDVIKFVVTVDTGTSVTATATNATIVTDYTGASVVSASAGSASTTIAVGTGTTATFYVYSKTTTVGSVAIVNGAYSTVVFVKGTAGTANAISLAGLDTAAAGTTQTLTARSVDVFGNLVSGLTVNAVVGNGTITTGGTIANAGVTSALTTSADAATLGTAEFKVAIPASGTTSVTIYATVAAAVTGLTAPIGTVSKSIVIRDLATELASIQAQLIAANIALASERTARAASDKALADAKVASDSATVTAKAASDLALAAAKAEYKAKFNALAKKWNAKNPRAKVTLIK